MKKPFLPRPIADQHQWLNHFADRLPGAYATKYGITTAELLRVEHFRVWNNWTFTVLDDIRQKAQAYTAFRDDLATGKSVASGPLSLPLDLALPPMPADGTPPVTITPEANGFGFVSTLAARIKNHADYAIADGDDLGLEGAAQPADDPATTQPALNVKRGSGGSVELTWPKHGFSATKLEVDRGTGQFVSLTTSTGSHFTDPVTLAPGVAAIWKYRAIYLKGDHVFGQWSDVVSIAVVG